MNSHPITALFIGEDVQLMEIVCAITRLDRGQPVTWILAEEAMCSSDELNADQFDVIVVDEQLWTGEVRVHLEQLRERVAHTPIVLLCGADTVLLGPDLLGVQAVQLLARNNTAIVLPSLLAWLDAAVSDSPPVRKQILIIDDSYGDRELYMRSLRQAKHVSYSAVEAAEGTRALELMRRISPECILLDYSLPGRNGLEVLRNIRGEWPDVPVIMLTDHGDEAVAVEALKSGAQDCLLKAQIEGDKLHRAIVSACEKRALQQRIVQQRDALELFTRALAHDLKEPLRTIRSYVDLIRASEQLTDRNLGFLGTISAAASHMERLVGMVMHYARLEAEPASNEREVCEASDLVQQALKNVAQLTSNMKHEIIVGELPRIYGNPVQLTNVFQNLISNALNYGNPALTRIDVRCKTEELQHIFSVEDNGVGIDPRHKHLLFQPFKRINAGQTRGSGLGLALCKKIVENHHGRIWVESTVGQGTKVSFTLPALTVAPSLQLPAMPRAIRASDLPPERDLANVLLVEDNEADVVLTQVLLQETDGLVFNIHSVSNGELALQWLADPNKPAIDLILLDINMPVMDGFTFLHALRGEDRYAHTELPVIMCSTSEEQRDLNEARGLGVVAYVTKPVRLAQLEEPLRDLRSLVLNRERGAPRLERRRARASLSTPATR